MQLAGNCPTAPPPSRHNSLCNFTKIVCLLPSTFYIAISHRNMSLNPFAQSGFAKASDYDAHRPSFPSASVDNLLENVRVRGKKGATVVDLAAGTGKFTELLAKRDEGFRVIAVEPHPDMRGVLEKKQLDGVQVMEGISTSIPLPDDSVDAVIAAQVSRRTKNHTPVTKLIHAHRRRSTGSPTWNRSKKFIACSNLMAHLVSSGTSKIVSKLHCYHEGCQS